MTTDAWQRVEEIFERVAAAPAAARAAILAEACGDDAELRAEVESLLEHDHRAGDDFLSSPIVLLRPDEQHRAPAWATVFLGRKVGRYTVTRLIGHGGMGCVFEARQEQPARTVALKVLQPGFSAPSALARFRLEPEVLGRLQHPNIAQVFEAGVHEDEHGAVPFFAMEFIADALPLLEYAAAHELPTRQRLELFAKVCDAIHHGHQKGIIHRDIKPANILIGADAEAEGHRFWRSSCLRRGHRDDHAAHACGRLGRDRALHEPRAMRGGFRSDRQIRSDVYSLGVVLYELLTGVPPYDTARTTIYAAIRAIKDETPRRPSRINHRLRGDIEVILLKALEKDRARRYASAADFAADVRGRH